ncbi:MAP/microtubule affinity-regulating kinase 4-like [Corticium candelabrum]|uniref:MAP/microtubule affinity-regulating kinase 4-like n=1 Tax=Corticium candelabrum TaxID=121492 RepID=UPI002E272BE8|nr:MAP/microtubule affinity-regulating kinase 4-like [Corticium candelabrum]
MSSHSGSTLNSERRHSVSGKEVRCIGRYLLTGKTLGKGNFARVELATHTITHAKVAIKLIEIEKIREDYVRRNLLREAQIMRRIRHPNIIRLYETMKTNTLYCLVTEVAEGGELLAHVRNDYAEKRLSEPQARPFVRQLVSAIHHLHSEGIVHRDLKMENILLDKRKRNIKIVDFGLSNQHQPGELLATHCGSPEYAAPELFIPGQNYGPEVDVWSLGVNMFAMLCGKLPFRGPRERHNKRQKLLEQIAAGISDSQELEMSLLSPACVDLIRHLLQVKPSQRITLLEVMDHPWITKHGLYLLHPYKPLPQDQEAHKKIIQLISTQLDLTKHEIENAVSTNKCDWIAAIFHLLIDQPEGRTYMSQIAVETSYDRSRTSLGLSPELALIETSIARSENVEKDNKTASEQKAMTAHYNQRRNPNATCPVATSTHRDSRGTSLPPPSTAAVNFVANSKFKPRRHLSTSEGNRRLPPTPNSVLAARHQSGLRRSLKHYATSPNTIHTQPTMLQKDSRILHTECTHKGMIAENRMNAEHLAVYDRAANRGSPLKFNRGRNETLALSGEPPSKRYSWANSADYAYTVPTRKQWSRESLNTTAVRANLFQTPGKAPADIASLMALPSPGVISLRDDGITTSSSSNGSTPKSPTNSFQSNVLHSPDDPMKILQIMAAHRRPQTVATAQREVTMMQPDRHKQLPSIETVPLNQIVHLPVSHASPSKKTISGILGRAFRFKHGKKGGKQ